MDHGFLKGIKLALGVAASATIWANAAAAQGFDPNIQTRIDSLVTAPPELELKTETVTTRTVETVRRPVRKSREELLRDLNRRKIALPEAVDALSLETLEQFSTKNEIPLFKIMPMKTVVTTTKEVPKPTWEASASANYNYESNANLSRLNPIADRISALNAALGVAVPIENNKLSAYVNVTSVRYDKLPGQNFDLLVGGLSYAVLLRKWYMGPDSKGPATSDLLTFGLEGQTLQAPHFGGNVINYLVPSLALARNEIGLSDKVCPKKKTELYCHFANISLATKYVASDVPTQRNAVVALLGTIGWRTPVSGLTLSATAALVGRRYTDRPDDRRDLIASLAAQLVWVPHDNFAFSALVKVIRQWSSVTAVEWKGYVFYPQAKVTINF